MIALGLGAETDALDSGMNEVQVAARGHEKKKIGGGRRRRPRDGRLEEETKGGSLGAANPFSLQVAVCLWQATLEKKVSWPYIHGSFVRWGGPHNHVPTLAYLIFTRRVLLHVILPIHYLLNLQKNLS